MFFYFCEHIPPSRSMLGIVLISDPRRGCYMGLLTFVFFFFFPATILSGPYLWNCYLQRLQIECAAWSCGLIVHCCLPSNSLRFFFFFFFSPRFFPGHISGTVTRRDSKLSVLLGPAVYFCPVAYPPIRFVIFFFIIFIYFFFRHDFVRAISLEPLLAETPN